MTGFRRRHNGGAGVNVYNGLARVDELSNVQSLKHGMGQIDICIASQD